MSKKAIVIGSGISGLSITRMLAHQYEVKVIERSPSIGGLIKCERINGNLFHRVGGHVFNSKNADVIKWFWDHFDKETEFLEAIRNAKILFNDKLIGYPIENFLHQLPPDLVKQIVKDLLDEAHAPPREGVFDLAHLADDARLQPCLFTHLAQRRLLARLVGGRRSLGQRPDILAHMADQHDLDQSALLSPARRRGARPEDDATRREGMRDTFFRHRTLIDRVDRLSCARRRMLRTHHARPARSGVVSLRDDRRLKTNAGRARIGVASASLDALLDALASALSQAVERIIAHQRRRGTVLVAVDPQDLEQVLLGVQVVRIALDELAHDGDRMQLEQLDHEQTGQFGVIVVHQRDDGGVLEGENGVGGGFVLEDLFRSGDVGGEPGHVHRDTYGFPAFAQRLRDKGLVRREQVIRIKALANEQGISIRNEHQLARLHQPVHIDTGLAQGVGQLPH